MPNIQITETVSTPTGATAPAAGTLTFTPTGTFQGAGASEEVLPLGFTVALDATGSATVNLAPTGPNWCWRVDRYLNGVSSTVWVAVTSTDSSWPALARVNPSTLTPASAPGLSWDAAISKTLADPSTASSQSVHSTSAGLAAALSIVFGG